MKRTIFAILMVWLGAVAMQAIPAHRGAVRVAQADGTMLTLRLIGDEYLHYNVTDDGYSVVSNGKGSYVYARMGADGQLAPTTLVAHDAGERQSAETSYLQQVGKYLTPRMTAERAHEQQAEQARQARARQQRRAPQYDYQNFRGLLILVEFNDRSFSRPDIRDIMDDMVNREGYTGYVGTNGRRQTYTGSVRDYFSDQSDGQFQPEFDVYGPYQIDYSQYDAEGTRNVPLLTTAALDAADDDIDFSQYDRDGDGWVDMVYFIFAGYGANYGGNDSRLYWPHRSAIYNPLATGWDDWMIVKDGVGLYDYASSVELYGYTAYPQTVTIDGIGTICHEFGHVLGLPDLYDTNYEENGQSNHPAEWSVMAGGSYANYGRTPSGYTLFERYALGFATPTLISDVGSFELPSVGSSNTGYRLNTRTSREYFLLENRQQTDKWDRYLPGHGMLVFRVDSTNSGAWDNNSVNANTRHNYFELVRAGGAQGATASDPFPGTKNVTELNNTTTPANLLTWAGLDSPFGLTNIKESGGVVTFDIEDVEILLAIGLPERVNLGLGRSILLQPTCKPDYIMPTDVVWTSSDPEVAMVNADGRLTALNEGEAVITAMTENKRQEELTATCLVVVERHQLANDIATFNSLDEGAQAELHLRGAQVLHVHDGTIYLRDQTGAIAITNSTMAVGSNDVINGFVYGTRQWQGLVPTLMLDADAMGYDIDVATGGEAEPVQIRVDSLTDRHYADLLTLKKARLERQSDRSLWAVGNNGRKIKLWNTFGLSGIVAPNVINNKRFDVTGILHTMDDDNGEPYDVIALFKSPKSVSFDPNEESGQGIASPLPDPTQSVDVYTTDGRHVVRTTMEALHRHSLPAGLYILKYAGGQRKVVM